LLLLLALLLIRMMTHFASVTSLFALPAGEMQILI